MSIKTEASDDDQFMESKEEDCLLLISAKVKCEDKQSDTGWGPSSELSNFEETSEAPFSIKQEPEDPSTSALKEEFDIEVEDHKPGWEQIKGSSSHVGMFKGAPDRRESLQESESLEARFSESKRGELKYNCAHCLFKTNNRSNFVNHYKYKHSKDAADVYKCQECSYETIYKNVLTRHYQNKHSEDAKVHKCQRCSFESIYKCDLTEHHKRKHSEGAEVYRCRECFYETTYKSVLTRHYQNKHSKDAKV